MNQLARPVTWDESNGINPRSGLKIMACERTMTSQKYLLTGHFDRPYFHASNVIADVLN